MRGPYRRGRYLAGRRRVYAGVSERRAGGESRAIRTVRRGSPAGLRIVVLGAGAARMVVLDVVVVRMMMLDRAVAGLVGGAGLDNLAVRGHMNMRVREDRGQRVERQRQPGKIKIPVDPHRGFSSDEQTRHFRAYSKAGLLAVDTVAYSKPSREAAPYMLRGAPAAHPVSIVTVWYPKNACAKWHASSVVPARADRRSLQVRFGALSRRHWITTLAGMTICAELDTSCLALHSQVVISQIFSPGRHSRHAAVRTAAPRRRLPCHRESRSFDRTD